MIACIIYFSSLIIYLALVNYLTFTYRDDEVSRFQYVVVSLAGLVPILNTILLIPLIKGWYDESKQAQGKMAKIGDWVNAPINPKKDKE